MKAKHWFAVISLPILFILNGLTLEAMVFIVVAGLLLAIGLALYDIHQSKTYYESENDYGADDMRGSNS